MREELERSGVWYEIVTKSNENRRETENSHPDSSVEVFQILLLLFGFLQNRLKKVGGPNFGSL